MAKKESSAAENLRCPALSPCLGFRGVAVSLAAKMGSEKTFELEVDESEAKTPLEAFQKLGVCSQLAEAAVSLGWKAPSAIQVQAIPRALQGGSRF
jgi:superfamily II DNA/RNA helicase